MPFGKIQDQVQVPGVDSLCYLAAFPTEESVEYLRQVFMSSPLTIHWGFIHVPLWAGPLGAAPDVRDGSLFVGIPEDLGIMMDPLTGNFELSARLESMDLQTELVRVGHTSEYPLRLSFQSYPPNLTMANKFFITSVSDAFATSRPTLTFRERLVALRPDFNAADPSSQAFVSVA